MSTPLTPLEKEILCRVADAHWPGFQVDGVVASRREHTGVGRYTYLEDHRDQSIRDGSYGVGYHFIQMEGVPRGLFFVVEITDCQLVYIEIVSSGGEPWDGVERSWTMVSEE